MVAKPFWVKLTSDYTDILKFTVYKFWTFLVKFCTKVPEAVVVIGGTDTIFCSRAVQRTGAQIQDIVEY